MHDPLEFVEQLSETARCEQVPKVDVSRDVLRQLRRTETSAERPLLFLAAGSFIAAVIVMIYGYSLISTLTDPLGSMYQVLPLFLE